MPLAACDEIAMPKAKTKAASANIYAVLGSDEAEVKRVAQSSASNLTPPAQAISDWKLLMELPTTVDQAEARVDQQSSTANGCRFLAAQKWFG